MDKNSIVYKAACLIAAEKIAGDYLEFGTFTGGSFIAAYHGVERAFRELSTPNLWNSDRDCEDRMQIWTGMRFFAFDSFQGLPELSGIDKNTKDFVAGKFACSRTDFENNVKAGGVPLPRVRTVPGWFDESLTAETIQRQGLTSAAIVHVDVDLYESAKTVLRFVTPLLVQGSVLIFDDWYNFKGDPHQGEQRACREWLDEHPEWRLVDYQKEGPWRNSFIASKA